MKRASDSENIFSRGDFENHGAGLGLGMTLGGLAGGLKGVFQDTPEEADGNKRSRLEHILRNVAGGAAVGGGLGVVSPAIGKPVEYGGKLGGGLYDLLFQKETQAFDMGQNYSNSMPMGNMYSQSYNIGKPMAPNPAAQAGNPVKGMADVNGIQQAMGQLPPPVEPPNAVPHSRQLMSGAPEQGLDMNKAGSMLGNALGGAAGGGLVGGLGSRA